MFSLATTGWTLYFIFGLPSDHLQTTSFWPIIIFGEISPALALATFGWRRCARTSALVWRIAAWIAFYMTVPLLLYDYLYLAVHQQRGRDSLRAHWYLTVFYIIPWLLLPPVAWRAARLAVAPKKNPRV